MPIAARDSLHHQVLLSALRRRSAMFLKPPRPATPSCAVSLKNKKSATTRTAPRQIDVLFHEITPQHTCTCCSCAAYARTDALSIPFRITTSRSWRSSGQPCSCRGLVVLWIGHGHAANAVRFSYGHQTFGNRLCSRVFPNVPVQSPLPISWRIQSVGASWLLRTAVKPLFSAVVLQLQCPEKASSPGCTLSRKITGG